MKYQEYYKHNPNNININVYTSAIEAFGRISEEEKCFEILKEFSENIIIKNKTNNNNNTEDEILKLTGTFETMVLPKLKNNKNNNDQRTRFRNLKNSTYDLYNLERKQTNYNNE